MSVTTIPNPVIPAPNPVIPSEARNLSSSLPIHHAPFPPTCHPESREAGRRIPASSTRHPANRLARFIALFLIAALLAATTASRVLAQNPETMMPEASATKAKQLLAQMIDAMGAYAFMNYSESQCTGRVSQFGHNNDLTSYLEFKDYWRYPDKNRTDYGKKGNIIDLFLGNDGWTMDHDGVSEEPSEKVYEFQDKLKKDPRHLLRYRLKEEGMVFRYGGQDLIDLKPVDWVELQDRDGRTYRIAIQRENHFLVRYTVLTKDTESGELIEEVTSYANFHPFDGVETPLQAVRTRNGRRMSQAFYDSCTYNPHLAPDFFTKAALERRFDEVGSRADKKKARGGKD